MILGILSDTHGRVPIAMEAIKVLGANGAEYFIHCGDIGRSVVGLLPRERSAFVFGNCDLDPLELIDEAQRCGVRCLRDEGVVELEGKSVAVTHGHLREPMDAFIDAGTHDYLLTGHTHVPHDLRVGKTRRINPGALHRARTFTCATLDLKTDVLRMFEIVPS